MTELTPDGLGARVGHGARLIALIRLASTGTQVLSSVILARLLTPEDFGIVGMAAIFAGIGALLRDMGLRQALVQRPRLEPSHLVAAFWTSLLLGALMCSGAVLLAPSVGEWFDEPRMVGPLRLVSVTFLSSAFETVPGALIERSLQFRKLLWPTLLCSISYAAVAITLSLAGAGFWSLVVATVASFAVGSMALCIVTRYVPPFPPSLNGIGDLYSFGLGVTGSGIAGWAADQIDYLIVGRCLGSAALGLYTRAFTVASMPLTQLGGTMSTVLLPAFSSIQEDPHRLRAAFARTLGAIGTLSVPALSVLAAISPEFVEVVFGHKWLGAVMPLQLLCIAALLRSLNYPAASLIRATGRPGPEAIIRLAYAVAVGGLAMAALEWGIVGVASAVVIASAMQAALMLGQVARSAQCTPSDYWAALHQPLLIGLVGSGACVACRAIASHLGLGPVAFLVLACTVVAASLGALVFYGPMGRTRALLGEIFPAFKCRWLRR